MIANEPRLLIPDYDPYHPEPYPGGIKPGYYNNAEVEALIEKHGDNPEALQFVADMIEL